MIRTIRYFVSWLKWLKSGKPYLLYAGYHCGLCGVWVRMEFRVPEYQSLGEWWDGWGVCPLCNNRKVVL